MDRNELKRARSLFEEAQDLEPEEVDGFLKEACGSDTALFQFVGELVDGYRQFENTADEQGRLREAALPDEPVRYQKGQRIAGYTVERDLDSGGMGIVYLAMQDTPRRPVALKLIRRTIPTERERTRFEMEIEVLGQLKHPWIAQIFEGKLSDPPFIAMEYVEGKNLTEFIRDNDPSIRERVSLLSSIAEAIHYAHQKGVVHRDLKPSNIMVTDDGTPKIIDFGIAKSVDREGGESGTIQQTGTRIGTPSYMSPEQAHGRSEEVDIRTDIYSLGVIAFEVIGGRLPNRPGNPDEPDGANRQQDGVSLGELAPKAKGDLELVVKKAMSVEVEKRYPSSGTLAGDFVRWLRCEPILGRPSTLGYVLGKAIVRRRRGVLVASVVVLLTSGLVALQWRKASHEVGKAAEIVMASAGDSLPSVGYDIVIEIEQLIGSGVGQEIGPLGGALLGTIQRRFGNRDAAQGLLANAVDAKPLDAQTSRALALILRSKDLMVRREPGGSLTAAQEAASLLPNDSPFFGKASEHVVRALIINGRAEEARDSFREIDPRKPVADQIEELLAIVYSGYLLGYCREAKQAVDACNDLYLANDLNKPDLQRKIQLTTAGYSWRLGEYDVAEKIDRSLLETADTLEEKGRISNNLGVVLRDSGRFVEGRKYLEDALKIRMGLKMDADQVAATENNLARLSELEEDLELARELYNRAGSRLSSELFIVDEATLGLVRIQIQEGLGRFTKVVFEGFLSRLDRSHGMTPWKTGESKSIIGYALFKYAHQLKMEGGDLERAERYLVDGYNMIVQSISKKPIGAKIAYDRLVEFFHETGRPKPNFLR